MSIEPTSDQIRYKIHVIVSEWMVENLLPRKEYLAERYVEHGKLQQLP
jgi:hypothetical protein